MPDKTRDDDEVKWLEEVARQAELRLAALAQSKQVVAAQATTVMTCILTLFSALIAALVYIAPKNEFASAWLLLFSSVLIFVVPAAVMSVVAVLTSLRSPESRERRWHHAGANPRIFIPDIPEESELGPVQQTMRHMRKRFAMERASSEQIAAPRRTKRAVLHSTVVRYSRAIDEDERSVSVVNDWVGHSVFMILIGGISALLTPLALELRPSSSQSGTHRPVATAFIYVFDLAGERG